MPDRRRCCATRASSVDAAEHRAVRPPAAPEEEQDRQDDGDDDPPQHAEEHHPERGDEGERKRRLAHPVVAAEDRRSPSARGRRRSRPRRASVWGRSASSELRNSRSAATRPAPTRPVTWLLAPDCSATAVRELLVDTAKALEEAGGDVGGAHADHLLVGVDLVAAPGGEARRRGDGVGERDERDADGGDEQRADVADARSRGRPAWARPAAGTRPSSTPSVGELEGGGDDRGADDGHEHRWHAAREPRQHQQDEQTGAGRRPASSRRSGRDRRRTPAPRR